MAVYDESPQALEYQCHPTRRVVAVMSCRKGNDRSSEWLIMQETATSVASLIVKEG